jgi:hypothetical protein
VEGIVEQAIAETRSERGRQQGEEKGFDYHRWQAKPPTPPRTLNGLQALVG